MPGLRRRQTPGRVDHLRDAHVLVVPTTVDALDVDALVRTWYPGADLVTSGRARLPGAGELSGPVNLSMEDAVTAEVPTPWTVAYALDVGPSRTRGRPPRRPDGLHRAFPEGLPTGAELAGLEFLLAAARRLGGGVRPAGSPEVLVPDPASAVDFRVVSPRWVRAADVAAVAGQEGEDVSLAVDGRPADLSEAAAVADGTPFEVRLSLGPAGAVAVVARVADENQPGVAGEEFATEPAALYDVAWVAPDASWRFSDDLDGIGLACRERARAPIEATARTLAELGGGIVLDADGFLVDRYQL